ncbi:hypothetical protein GCM10011571_33600 [Marinithermofilum abyssi]|uniref:Uncharacterized protein n=1 Tax=Marinithermofilum abyssi TaxID=1571185 RepID=A0A8J2VKS5_9BACL|nr:hypothetical protein [Marinithermofilum abyssi]GGE28756.1 hypothetical protein GCM10011571_33600 [Marinithermofilum abyssi]
MKCRFCGEELYCEYEEWIGGHQGCIEEMRYYEELEKEKALRTVTATIVVQGKGSTAWRGNAENAYEKIVEMIESVLNIPGETEIAFFSLVVEDAGGSATGGHPEEILALARLDMQRLGLYQVEQTH